jgi:hypothetical protein
MARIFPPPQPELRVGDVVVIWELADAPQFSFNGGLTGKWHGFLAVVVEKHTHTLDPWLQPLHGDRPDGQGRTGFYWAVKALQLVTRAGGLLPAEPIEFRIGEQFIITDARAGEMLDVGTVVQAMGQADENGDVAVVNFAGEPRGVVNWRRLHTPYERLHALAICNGNTIRVAILSPGAERYAVYRNGAWAFEFNLEDVDGLVAAIREVTGR